MENLEGPPPLIPIFDVEDDDNEKSLCSSPIMPVLDMKDETSFSTHDTPTETSQLGSPVSFNREKTFESREVTLVKNVNTPSCSPKNHKEQPQLNQTISRPVDPLSCTSENMEPNTQQPQRPATPGNEDILDPRVEFIVNDPMILQDIIFKEKCREFSNVIDPDIHLHPFHVAAFFRLRRMYHLGLISVRLDGVENNKRIVFASKSFDLNQILPSSIEINEFLMDWTHVPSVIVEMISTSNCGSFSPRYLMLYRDSVYNYWELMGCLGHLNPPITPTPREEPPDLPLPFFGQEETTEPSMDDSYNFVEITPDIDGLSCNESVPAESSSEENSPPVIHIPENDFSIKNPILQQILACPQFIFPSLGEEITNNVHNYQLPFSPSNRNNFCTENLPNLYLQLMERSEKSFKCQFCPKEFTSKKSLNNHAKHHDPMQLIQCSHCRYKTPYRSTLNRHLKKSHPLVIGDVDP